MAVWNCSDESINELKKINDGILKIMEEEDKYFHQLYSVFEHNSEDIGPHANSIATVIDDISAAMLEENKLIKKLSIKLIKAINIRRNILENDRYLSSVRNGIATENNALQNHGESSDVFSYNGKELGDVKVGKLDYIKKDKLETQSLRQVFNSKVRKEFIKTLVENNKKELLKVGLSTIDIKMMEDGLIPKGCQVHHIKPIDDSGDNSLDNLVLIDSRSHLVVTLYQNSFCHNMKKGELKRVKWPFFKKPYYIRRD